MIGRCRGHLTLSAIVRHCVFVGGCLIGDIAINPNLCCFKSLANLKYDTDVMQCSMH